MIQVQMGTKSVLQVQDSSTRCSDSRYGMLPKGDGSEEPLKWPGAVLSVFDCTGLFPQFDSVRLVLFGS
jgi:hypothetical protein